MITQDDQRVMMIYTVIKTMITMMILMTSDHPDH